jgi:hypothetical protein
VQADVALPQATVGYLPEAGAEVQSLTSEVELEDVVVHKLPVRRVVGPPDDVEALADPRPAKPGEPAERMLRRFRRCGERGWFSGCAGRIRFVDWWQRVEDKV